MDSYSYPYHRNQMMSAPYYCPSGQIGRPHLKVDPMVPCEFWPFQFGGNQGGGYAYPVPEFHGCHYQPQPSCCAFRPPYPYAAPPHHCHGIYSAYPGSYPVHYVPPPPYFSTDQPLYEFEKNLPTTQHHHCCGCPNHSCKQSDSDKKCVKIVEHDEEDIDRKNAPQNHPYPLVLLPYGGDMRREHTKPYHEAKPSSDLESSEQPQNLRNGWPPLNMKRSQGMKKGEDLQTNSVQKQDDNSVSFPFPIFWMPYQPENTGKVESEESGFGQNPPDQKLASHIESMHKDEDDDKTNKSMQNEVTGNNVTKIIPVKQLEENDMKKGTSEENGAKKLSSPKKPSKLAPVCLRVDPLPRKKGSSRSPSPPAGKGKSQDMPKDSTQGDGKKDLEVEERKCRTKTTQGDGQKDLNVSTSPSDNQIGNGGVEAPFEPEKKCSGESTQSQCDNTEGEGQIKKQLSEDEAAAVIQSAYRAYEVRKWEPLKKLKQIASVGEKMAEIRGHIQALEHSPDKLVDNKQRNVISETIMSLLLKLDTIQGLHPTVRDIRKSVARELVGLQEKLDSIPDSSPQVVTEQPLTDKHTEDTMRIHQDGNVTVAQSHHDTNIMEQCEEQPLPVENSQSMVVNGQGGENEQIDEIFGESQPPSKELEVKEISEHEQCLSSPHRQTEELTYCDVDVKDLVDLSQEEHNAQDSSLPKQMDHDVKEVAEVNTEFSEEIITSCEDQQVTQTPPCAVDEESESLASAQTATTGNARMPQDEASRGLETEPFIKESIDMAEQLLPDSSNMECEEKEVQEPKPYGITAEAQVENVGVLNEVAELLELNDDGRIEEHKEIHGSVKGEIGEDEFSSTLQQEVIMESDGSTTKVNEAEELVEVPVEKSKGAVDKDPESIDLKPRELELEVDDRKLEEEENVAESGSSREAKETIGEVENIDWSMCSEANEQEEIVTMSPLGSQISIQSEDNGRKLIEENEKLRKLLEEMIESGKEQLTTISTLSGRVKQLERKLSRRKKLKMRQCRAAHVKNDVYQVM